jgi:hypothetical protein
MVLVKVPPRKQRFDTLSLAHCLFSTSSEDHSTETGSLFAPKPDFGDHGFGGEPEAGDVGRVLEGGTGDAKKKDNPCRGRP